MAVETAFDAGRKTGAVRRGEPRPAHTDHAEETQAPWDVWQSNLSEGERLLAQQGLLIPERLAPKSSRESLNQDPIPDPVVSGTIFIADTKGELREIDFVGQDHRRIGTLLIPANSSDQKTYGQIIERPKSII